MCIRDSRYVLRSFFSLHRRRNEASSPSLLAAGRRLGTDVSAVGRRVLGMGMHKQLGHTYTHCCCNMHIKSLFHPMTFIIITVIRVELYMQCEVIATTRVCAIDVCVRD